MTAAMMDVRCVKCSTEYEFEIQRVPTEGLSVKCSQCAHVFKVFRDDQPQPGIWKVRQKTGNLFEFRELTTLQRWIVERKVGREDEISKTGKNWKRLGDIAELAAFFQVVEKAETPDQQTNGGPDQSSSFPGGGPQAAVAQPIIQHTSAHTNNDSDWNMADLDPPANAAFIIGDDTPSIVGQPNPLAAAPVAPRPPPPEPLSQPVRQRRASAPVPEMVADDYDDDLYDEFDAPRSGGKGKWVVAILLLLALGGGGAYLYRPEFFTQFLGPKVPELAVSHVKTGYIELRKDSNAGIAAAISNFEKGIALAADYADAKSGLAESLINQAEWKSVEAAELEAKLVSLEEAPDEEKKPLQDQITELRAAAARIADQAFNVGKEALVVAPEALAPNRAMADYYRYKAAEPQMQPLLDRAKLVAPNDPGVAYVIGSNMMRDPASQERAIRYFDTALEAAPDMQRARFKIARIYQLQGSPDKALRQIDAILTAVPDHDRAKALKLVLQPPEPVAVEEPPKQEEEPPMTPERLVRQADRLRDRDQPRKAMGLYEKAVDQEPGNIDGLNGLAWCYYDLEEYDASIVTFKRVLAKVPRFSDAHMGLATVYEEKSMKRDALKHYQKYLDIVPNGPDASVARSALSRLK